MNMLESPLKYGVGAEFMLIVRKASSGREVRRSGWSHNMVVQTGFDLALSGSGTPQFRVVVGAGNTPPTIGDTTLQASLASTSTLVGSGTTTHQTLVEPFWARQDWTFRFNAGQFDGDNISEVALFQQNTSVMYSRALVVDANGNPSVVSVQADEYLDVVVRHYLVMGTSSGSFNQMILGNVESFDYTVRPIKMSGNYEWGGNTGNVGRRLPIISFTPNATYAYTNADLNSPSANDMLGTRLPTSATMVWREPYVNGDGVAKLRFSFGLGTANGANGISGVVIHLSTFVFQILLSPAVPKTSAHVYNLDLDVSMVNAVIPE